MERNYSSAIVELTEGFSKSIADWKFATEDFDQVMDNFKSWCNERLCWLEGVFFAYNYELNDDIINKIVLKFIKTCVLAGY